MATKIYVSQIDTANSTGGQAPINSTILIGSQGPYWSNATIFEIFGLNPNELVGYIGSAGATGFSGSVGFIGSVGFQGSTGADGALGAVGYTGSAGEGYQGSAGFQGSVGFTGSEGDVGPQGDFGYTGSQGDVGFQGSAGFRGSLGATGFSGSVGFAGSGGSITFTSITDVPQSYTGANDFFVRVNSTANGIIFDGNTYLTSSISGTLNFSGNTLNLPVLQGYGELVNERGNSTSVISIDVRDGNIQTLTLNAGIVDVVLSTAGLNSGTMYSITLFIKQDATGGRIIDWSNQTIYWPTAEGTYDPVYGPTLSTAANYTDIITLVTYNAGTTWYGFLSGKGFATT